MPNKNKMKDVVLGTKEEAGIVIEHLRSILPRYGNVSVEDLHDLIGLPSTDEDHKLGWTNLDNVTIRQVENGFLLELPPLEGI